MVVKIKIKKHEKVCNKMKTCNKKLQKLCRSKTT